MILLPPPVLSPISRCDTRSFIPAHKSQVHPCERLSDLFCLRWECGCDVNLRTSPRDRAKAIALLKDRFICPPVQGLKRGLILALRAQFRVVVAVTRRRNLSSTVVSRLRHCFNRRSILMSGFLLAHNLPTHDTYNC